MPLITDEDIREQLAGLTEQWLEELLDRGLDQIVESLEKGERISSSDFVRLVKMHNEIGGSRDEFPIVEWRDSMNEDDAE